MFSVYNKLARKSSYFSNDVVNELTLIGVNVLILIILALLINVSIRFNTSKL